MKIYLIGTGMGGRLTSDAEKAINEADVYIGAERMLECLGETKKTCFVEYRAKEISKYLKEHKEFNAAAILLSGDIAFCSGAKKLREELAEYDITTISGISSFSYLCGKIGAGIEETKLVSLHGDNSDYYNKKSLCNIVRDNKYTFVLLNEVKDINSVCTLLSSYKLDGCTVHIGSRMGYKDERIISTPISYMFDAENEEIEAPVSILIENQAPMCLLGRHIKDEEFIRDGKTPMTKDEIRVLSISKLGLKNDSVLYDIGAGTGSVSVEASLISHDIKVFAVEKKSDVYTLVNQNRCKFGCDNIMLINGEAPTAIEYLPKPTHVFIGGSGGMLDKIVGCVLDKNPEVKIVINTIALNSAAEVMSVIKKYELDSDIISVNIAKSKKIGEYDMMMGSNQVYIFTLCKKTADTEENKNEE